MSNPKNRETTSAHAGQKIITDTPVDKSSYGHDGYHDRPMGGSIDNLSHSLSSGRAEQDADKGRKSTISKGP